MTTEETDRTEEGEQEGSSLRRSLSVTRRDVMRAAGASGVLAGYTGTAAAHHEGEDNSCHCEDSDASESQCFDTEAAEDCRYCKIDPIPEDGDFCEIVDEDGTITITVSDDGECITVEDPNNKVGRLALKSGANCECTVYSAEEVDEAVESGGSLCTLLDPDEEERCGQDISHITVEVCPAEEEPPSLSGQALNCERAESTVTNAEPGETLTFEVNFFGCPTYTETAMADGDGNATFEVFWKDVGRCYCTPTEYTVTGSESGQIGDSFSSGLEADECKPEFTVSGDCSSVTASLAEGSAPLLEGCPVDAYLETECGTFGPLTLSSSNTSVTFTAGDDYPCYCTPTDVSFDNTNDENSTVTFPTLAVDSLASGDCLPAFEATSDCSTVEVNLADGSPSLIEGCDIEARLVSDCDGDGIGEVTSAWMTLSQGSSPLATFDVDCYCTPLRVEFNNLDMGGPDPETVDVELTGGPCEVKANAPDANCSTISIDGTGVAGCPVTVEVTFEEGGCSVDPVTVTTADDRTWSATIDVPCYCTPTVVDVYEGSSASGTPVATFDDLGLDCTPAFDATFTCDKVTVEALSGLIEGCPVTATLYFVDECAPSRAVTLNATSTSDSDLEEIDISDLCKCIPDRVEFTTDSGRLLATETPSEDLNCVCETFTDVCRIDEGQIEDLCNGNDVTVQCGDAGTITFEAADIECSGGEVICFNFTSSFEVFRVFVKGGGGPDAGNEYIWSCGTFDSDDPEPDIINFETSDQTYNGKLCANKNPNNNKQTAVSHIDFSVCAEDLD